MHSTVSGEGGLLLRCDYNDYFLCVVPPSEVSHSALYSNCGENCNNTTRQCNSMRETEVYVSHDNFVKVERNIGDVHCTYKAEEDNTTPTALFDIFQQTYSREGECCHRNSDYEDVEKHRSSSPEKVRTLCGMQKVNIYISIYERPVKVLALNFKIVPIANQQVPRAHRTENVPAR